MWQKKVTKVSWRIYIYDTLYLQIQEFKELKIREFVDTIGKQI